MDSIGSFMQLMTRISGRFRRSSLSTEDAQLLLSHVDDSEHFVVASGERIQNLEGLFVSLMRMSQDDFASHVDGRKNDFYNWVSMSIKDETLAERIKGISDKNEMTIAVGQRVRELLTRLS